VTVTVHFTELLTYDFFSFNKKSQFLGAQGQ